MTEAASPPTVTLVIIDDNLGSLELLSNALAREGVEILTASDPVEGLDLIYDRHPSIVLTDLVMPNLSGMDVLDRVMEFDPAIDVVLMTAHYTTETAVEAIKKGAADYLNKPVPIAALRDRVERLLEEARKSQRALELEDEILAASEFEGIVGRSPMMREMFSRIRRVAPHFRTVLVTGDTGTGKELVARALHRRSPFAHGNLVVINCPAVVETLFESELFGHAKGSFTGATQEKPGLIEHATGGTLFLDEIGEMPLSTQAKLLRVLQNQEVLRVGSLHPRKVDVRVVAATNQDLRGAVSARRFREDLYYRLSMVEIRVPALADRKEDLPLLEKYFCGRFATQYGKRIRGLTHRAQIALGQHAWPGNVRELENALGHACMMVMSDTIDVQDLPEYLRTAHSARNSGAVRDDTAERTPNSAASAPSNLRSLQDEERDLILRALEEAGGNQSQAARLLRIGRDAFRYKLKKHQIQG